MLSKTSSRALLVGAILFSLNLGPAFAESSNNPDGPTITDGTGPYDSSTGDAGTSGHAGENGGNGGNGGDVTSVISTSSSGPLDGAEASSLGGNGGTGGEAVPGDGDGRDPVVGGNGGNGGDGGNIDLTLAGEVDGTVRARSLGGTAGQGGQEFPEFDGVPGVEGGNAGLGGSGGDVNLTIAGTAAVNGTVYAVSTGGTSNGKGSGDGGEINVTISGVVDGSVVAKSDGVEEGKIKVMLDGGVVTGTISADTSNTSSLSFKFDVADRDEFKAATLALTGSGAEGQVKINGNTYKWEGFSSLVDLLKYVGPEDKVVVSVKETSSNDTTTVGEPVSAPKATPKVEDLPVQPPKIVAGIEVIQGKPEMAKCSGGSEIRTVRLDSGSVVVIHHSRGADTLIGQLDGGEFQRASGAPDWTVRVSDGGKSVDVSDASGGALTSCAFS